MIQNLLCFLTILAEYFNTLKAESRKLIRNQDIFKTEKSYCCAIVLSFSISFLTTSKILMHAFEQPSGCPKMDITYNKK